MKDNQNRSVENLQNRISFRRASYLIGSALGISLKYVIPFAAGLYVGYMDGNNIEIEPKIKYTLLTAPTAVNIGLVLPFKGLLKIMGKLSTRPEIKDITIKYQRILNPNLRNEDMNIVYDKLEDLADTSLIKESLKVSREPGISTLVGYALGYSFTK